MTELRDYEAWHRQYDDPKSVLSWRLRQVALLLWSRGADDAADRQVNDRIRERFVRNGFVDEGYTEHDGAALGAVRYDGPPLDLIPRQHLFTFIR